MVVEMMKPPNWTITFVLFEYEVFACHSWLQKVLLATVWKKKWNQKSHSSWPLALNPTIKKTSAILENTDVEKYKIKVENQAKLDIRRKL